MPRAPRWRWSASSAGRETPTWCGRSQAGAQGEQTRRRPSRRGAGALSDGPRRHRPERNRDRVRKPLARRRGRGRAISSRGGGLFPRHRRRLRCASKAGSIRKSTRRWRAAGRSAASTPCCARCCAPRPTNSSSERCSGARRRLRICRRRRRVRRSARKPAWSMPCSISSRTNCALRNSPPVKPQAKGSAVGLRKFDDEFHARFSTVSG